MFEGKVCFETTWIPFQAPLKLCSFPFGANLLPLAGCPGRSSSIVPHQCARTWTASALSLPVQDRSDPRSQ